MARKRPLMVSPKTWFRWNNARATVTFISSMQVEQASGACKERMEEILRKQFRNNRSGSINKMYVNGCYPSIALSFDGSAPPNPNGTTSNLNLTETHETACGTLGCFRRTI